MRLGGEARERAGERGQLAKHLSHQKDESSHFASVKVMLSGEKQFLGGDILYACTCISNSCYVIKDKKIENVFLLLMSFMDVSRR